MGTDIYNKDFETKEELEAAFDEEYANLDDAPTEDQGEVAEEKEVETEENAEQDLEKEVEEPTIDPVEEKTETKDPITPESESKVAIPKKDFVAIKEAKKEIEQKYKAASTRTKRLAKLAGFGNDIDGYNKMLDEKMDEQEAKENNQTVDQYKKYNEKEQEIQTREQKIIEAETNLKIRTFDTALNTILKDYNLESEKDKVIESLGEQGFDLESLINVPNPKVIITGVLHDKIVEAEIQARTKQEEKFKDLDDTPIKTTKKVEKTIDEIEDELIAKEMAQYKKENGYN